MTYDDFLRCTSIIIHYGLMSPFTWCFSSQKSCSLMSALHVSDLLMSQGGGGGVGRRLEEWGAGGAVGRRLEESQIVHHPYHPHHHQYPPTTRGSRSMLRVWNYATLLPSLTQPDQRHVHDNPTTMNRCQGPPRSRERDLLLRNLAAAGNGNKHKKLTAMDQATSTEKR